MVPLGAQKFHYSGRLCSLADSFEYYFVENSEDMLSSKPDKAKR